MMFIPCGSIYSDAMLALHRRKYQENIHTPFQSSRWLVPRGLISDYYSIHHEHPVGSFILSDGAGKPSSAKGFIVQ